MSKMEARRAKYGGRGSKKRMGSTRKRGEQLGSKAAKREGRGKGPNAV